MCTCEMLVETKKAAYTLRIQAICYQSKNTFLQWIFWKRLHIVLEMAEKINNLESVLDFGSGWGLLCPSLSRIFKNVYGVDVNKVRIAGASRLIRFLNCKNVQILAVKPQDQLLMFNDKSISCIIAADVLEHVLTLQDTLSSFKRILANDGQLIISLPTENLLYRFVHTLLRRPPSYHVHNLKTVIGMIEENFEIKEQRNLFSFFKLIRASKQ